MLKPGRKVKNRMRQRFDIHLAREIRNTWGGKYENGKSESLEFIIRNMHEALKKLEKYLGEDKKHTAKELNIKLSEET